MFVGCLKNVYLRNKSEKIKLVIRNFIRKKLQKKVVSKLLKRASDFVQNLHKQYHRDLLTSLNR